MCWRKGNGYEGVGGGLEAGREGKKRKGKEAEKGKEGGGVTEKNLRAIPGAVQSPILNLHIIV